MTMLSPKPKQDMVRLICERIWLAVVQRSLRPGARLKEEDLAEIFGATRARVRQALTILEQDGLVVLVPNRGACIAEPGVEDARDAFSARLSIEERLILRLCHQAEAADIDALRAHITAERAAHAAGDLPAIIRLSGEFHMLIAQRAKADLLAKILRILTVRTSLITAMYQTEDVQTCGPDEHAQIVDAIASGNEAAAADAIRHHLQHLEAALRLDQTRRPVTSLRDALEPSRDERGSIKLSGA